MGSRLYFRAHRPDVGEELWSLNLSDPNANGDSATTTYGTAVSVNVLAYDSDMDSTLNQASVQIVVAPASGTTTIDLATGAITYTPNANFSGMDRFSYRVSDPQNHASNVAFVDVIVKPQLDHGRARNGTDDPAGHSTGYATHDSTCYTSEFGWWWWRDGCGALGVSAGHVRGWLLAPQNAFSARRDRARPARERAKYPDPRFPCVEAIVHMMNKNSSSPTTSIAAGLLLLVLAACASREAHSRPERPQSLDQLIPVMTDVPTDSGVGPCG